MPDEFDDDPVSDAETSVVGDDDTPAPSPPAEDAPAEDPSSGTRRFLMEIPILFLIAFGLALIIKTFFAQAFYIPSESMVPTLQIDDRVLVNKMVYRVRDPRRGEIIVFAAERGTEQRSFLSRVRSFFTEGLGVVRPDELDFIKRVIGLPGETVEVVKGKVIITPHEGKSFTLDESYTADEEDRSNFGPFTVPEDSYFVMGDNRRHSSDSRSSLGAIHRSDIIGKAFVRIWPLGRAGFFRTPAYDASAMSPVRLGTAEVDVGVGLQPWSRRGTWSANWRMRDSSASRAWMRPDEEHWPGRSLPAR